MGVDQPRIFVRARQRSRNALRAFDRSLIPAIGEVGVDRVQIRVAGSWGVLGVPHPDAITVDEYFDLLTSSHDVDWFRLPERLRNGLLIQTRSNPATTLGPMEISVNGRNEGRGRLSVNLKGANPTRTLAHLLADLGHEPDFTAVIAALGPFQFFSCARSPIPRAIGSNADNWLSDPDLVLRRLGADPFSAFLPIYAFQLQRLIADMLFPAALNTFVADGAQMALHHQGLAVRLDWGEVRVPQIECYFERHHVGAVGAVRAAAAVALAETDMTDVHRYSRPTSDWVERQDDCLSIGIPLNERYRIGIYAKSPLRFRFEVRRLKKGDYSELGRPAQPQDRLLAIIDMERRNLLNAAIWPRVGAMFDEQPKPQITDLTRLCALIAQVCIEHGGDVRGVMARLFEDGGISRNGHDGVPEALLEGLREVGVLHRVVMGRRDHRRPVKRYSLAPDYRFLMDAVMTGLTAAAGYVP